MGHKLPTNLYDARHMKIMLTITRFLLACGVPVDTEPLGLDSDPDQFIDTAYASCAHTIVDEASRKFLTDVTVVNPFREKGAGLNLSSFEESAARKKRIMHEAATQRINAKFYPLVFSTLGHWHPQTEEFLSLTPLKLQLDRYIVGPDVIDFPSIAFTASALAEAVACALQKGNALIVRQNLLSIRRRDLNVARFGSEAPADERTAARRERRAAAAAAGPPRLPDDSPDGPLAKRVRFDFKRRQDMR
jgi:hypothetical protein